MTTQRRPPLTSLAPRRILVRGTNWIGDTVMTLPALGAIRRTFPAARISALVKPWVADLLRLCPDVDEILLYEAGSRHGGAGGIFRLARDLRSGGFDMAILLQNAFEAALIAFLAGIPVRAGYASDGRRLLLTHAVRRTREVLSVHQTGYYLSLVRSLGCEPAGGPPALHLPDDMRRQAEGILAARGISPRDFLVGMAPGAAYGPAKRWFPERFAAVADLCSRHLSARILLFGGKADRDIAETVRRHARERSVNVAGHTDLRDAIALIASCRLFFTNDSGLMHVAGALDVPTVAVFGSTNPQATAPPGRNSVVVREPVACSPCLKKICPTDFRCMDRISAERVYEAGRSLLSGLAGNGSEAPRGGI